MQLVCFGDSGIRVARSACQVGPPKFSSRLHYPDACPCLELYVRLIQGTIIWSTFYAFTELHNALKIAIKNHRNNANIV
jgi:hypothetical protein